jgi:hypothetical protein
VYKWGLQKEEERGKSNEMAHKKAERRLKLREKMITIMLMLV